MKYVVIFVCFFLIFSCQKKENQSLDPLKIDLINNIPFLMIQMKIDSVTEVVSYGKIGSAKVDDTFNNYILTSENIVEQKLKSFMCCSFAYKYDSLGFLIEKYKFSDYSTDYTVSYQRNDNQIIELEKDNFNNTIRYVYEIKDERLMSKTIKSTLDSTYFENINFYYNSKQQLIKKIRLTKNDPEGEFVSMKIVTSYSWINDVLNETNEKQYSANGIDYFETITKFDLEGFPTSKIVNQNRDTICKTIIVKL